jgi:hypothetical protein
MLTSENGVLCSRRGRLAAFWLAKQTVGQCCRFRPIATENLATLNAREEWEAQASRTPTRAVR